jgi:hypothetical protein
MKIKNLKNDRIINLVGCWYTDYTDAVVSGENTKNIQVWINKGILKPHKIQHKITLMRQKHLQWELDRAWQVTDRI